jgi:hypothetical protein
MATLVMAVIIMHTRVKYNIINVYYIFVNFITRFIFIYFFFIITREQGRIYA